MLRILWLVAINAAIAMPLKEDQPKPLRNFKVELNQDNSLPLKLTDSLEKVEEFSFWGIKVYDKRTTDPFELDNPSMPRGWGTNHASASYHKNSEPLIIGISVVLASVIVFTMFGTIIWRRRRKSKSRAKLMPDTPRSTSTSIKKRKNPLKYLKHRKGKRVIPSDSSCWNLSTPAIQTDNDNDQLLQRENDESGTNDINRDSNESSQEPNQTDRTDQPDQSDQSNQPEESTEREGGEHGGLHEELHNSLHDSPPPFSLHRDTDSGALPALPPAYRPNHNIPSTSARRTEKSRYVNSRGNNELEVVEEHSQMERNDGHDSHDSHNNLRAHIAIDDKDHLQNLHLQSSTPGGELLLPAPSVPVADVDEEGYETLDESTHDTLITKSISQSQSQSSLPHPPSKFEPTFSPFDLPYSSDYDNIQKALPSKPQDMPSAPSTPSAPSAPPAPPMDSHTIEASAPPLESNDGRSSLDQHSTQQH